MTEKAQTFLTAPSQKRHNKYADRSKLEQLNTELTKTVECFDGKVVNLLNKQENEYLAAFHCYIAAKEEEIKQLQDLLKEAIYKGENQSKDLKMRFLEERLNAKSKETEYLLESLKEAQREILALKSKASRFQDDCDFLGKSLKNKIKENGILRCFLKEIENQNVINDAIKCKEMLDDIKNINKTQTSDELFNLNLHLLAYTDLLVNNTSPTKIKQQLSQKRTLSTTLKLNIPTQIPLNSPNVNKSFCEPSPRILSQYHRQILQQNKEINFLKQRLIKYETSRSLLSNIFEDCVFEVMKSKKDTDNEKLVKNIDKLDISKIELLVKSKTSKLNSKEKQRIIDLFIKNEEVLNKISELMFNIDNTKQNVPLLNIDKNSTNILLEPEILLEKSRSAKKKLSMSFESSNRNHEDRMKLREINETSRQISKKNTDEKIKKLPRIRICKGFPTGLIGLQNIILRKPIS